MLNEISIIWMRLLQKMNQDSAVVWYMTDTK